MNLLFKSLEIDLKKSKIDLVINYIKQEAMVKYQNNKKKTQNEMS